MQNGSSFFARLPPICMLSQCLLTKISASELSRKFITRKSALLVGYVGWHGERRGGGSGQSNFLAWLPRTETSRKERERETKELHPPPRCFCAYHFCVVVSLYILHLDLIAVTHTHGFLFSPLLFLSLFLSRQQQHRGEGSNILYIFFLSKRLPLSTQRRKTSTVVRFRIMSGSTSLGLWFVNSTYR